MRRIIIAHGERRNRFIPLHKTISASKNNGNPLQKGTFNTVQAPINMMEHEHVVVGKKVEQIRTLSNDYALPEDACASYSYLFKTLDEFENDLHIHVHLENNILFPKSLDF